MNYEVKNPSSTANTNGWDLPRETSFEAWGWKFKKVFQKNRGEWYFPTFFLVADDTNQTDEIVEIVGLLQMKKQGEVDASGVPLELFFQLLLPEELSDAKAFLEAEEKALRQQCRAILLEHQDIYGDYGIDEARRREKEYFWANASKELRTLVAERDEEESWNDEHLVVARALKKRLKKWHGPGIADLFWLNFSWLDPDKSKTGKQRIKEAHFAALLGRRLDF